MGLGVAGYLALYQLHSFVSRLLPVPDAALGAAASVADLGLADQAGNRGPAHVGAHISF